MTDRDYSALTRPVTPVEVKAFRQWARSSGWIDTARPPVSVVQVVFFALFGAVFLIIVSSFLTFVGSTLSHSFGRFASVLVPVGVLALVAGIAVAAWRGWAGSEATWEKRLRLREFASARGGLYTGHVDAPLYPGMIFDIGTDRRAYDSVRASSGRALDVSNYRYTVRRNKSSTVYRWGFVALKLDRRLPHMVLDATSNNLLFGSNLPRGFSKDSSLSLEGDFDRYFTLYCPPEYGRDALYVFTPDLMALLIDESSAFDVEIVDDWMFVYSTTPFELLDPAVWQRLDRIVDTVGSKTLRQTERYADERVADPGLNIVAPHGRRMKRGLGLGAVLATVVALGWVGFNAVRIWS